MSMISRSVPYWVRRGEVKYFCWNILVNCSLEGWTRKTSSSKMEKGEGVKVYGENVIINDADSSWWKVSYRNLRYGKRVWSEEIRPPSDVYQSTLGSLLYTESSLFLSFLFLNLIEFGAKSDPNGNFETSAITDAHRKLENLVRENRVIEKERERKRVNVNKWMKIQARQVKMQHVPVERDSPL